MTRRSRVLFASIIGFGLSETGGCGSESAAPMGEPEEHDAAASGGSGGTGKGGSGGTGKGGSGGMGVMADSGAGGSATGGSGAGGSPEVDAAEPDMAPVIDMAVVADRAPSADLAPGTSPMMSFFITSRTGDGNLGGLEGADKICQMLAANVGLGGKTWHAYLSNQNPKVDAKTRIGTGPWYNVKGVKIAEDVAGLHATSNAMGDTPGNMINGPNGLDEKGGMIPTGNPAQQHDILTGSNLDGTLAMNLTCMDWTGAGMARVGHFNRGGGGNAPNSWNAAHDNAGCTTQTITMRGGAGRFYCFATDAP
jgi:hypothetical protein